MSSKRKSVKKSSKKKATSRAPSTQRQTLLNQTDLARVFRVTTRTVQRWNEQGLPRQGEGRTAKYPLELCIAWVRKRDREEALEAARPKDLAEARLRKAIADAELAEYEVAERRGETMTVEHFEDLVGSAMRRMDAQLRTLPRRVAPELVGLKTAKEFRATLDGAVAQVRSELYAAGDVQETDEADAA